MVGVTQDVQLGSLYLGGIARSPEIIPYRENSPRGTPLWRIAN